MKRLLALILFAAVIMAVAAGPAWAWIGHYNITERAIAGMTLNSLLVAADVANGSSGEPAGVHTSWFCVSEGDGLFDGWTSSTIVGNACHYLADAGQPYHANNSLSISEHLAYENWVSPLLQDSVRFRDAIKNAGGIGLPISSTNRVNDHIQNLVNAASPECAGINNLVKIGIANLTAAQLADLKNKTITALARTSGYLKGAIDYTLFSYYDKNPIDGKILKVELFVAMDDFFATPQKITKADLFRILDWFFNGYLGYGKGTIAGDDASFDDMLAKLGYSAGPKPSLPSVTQLLPCTPNPVSQNASISYQLASPANVSLKVYNINGQLVKTLASETKPAGNHSVQWDGKDANGKKVAAGVYLYRLDAGDYQAVKKLTVIR